jgi:hypothetical protein
MPISSQLDFIDKYPESWRFRVAAGEISGVSVERKFGQNPDIGTSEEDLWNVGGDETLLSSAVTMYASATGAATQTLIVQGLGPDWKDQTGFVTLNGTAQAEIRSAANEAQTWTRINRAYQVSAAPDPGFDVYIAESDTLSTGVPQTAAKIHALIDFTNAAQQTQKALYTVPSGKVAFILNVEAYMGAATSGASRSAGVFIEVEQLATGASVGNPSWTPRRRIIEGTISTAAPQLAHTADTKYDRFTELTNIHLRAVATASSNIAGHFEMLIVDE